MTTTISSTPDDTSEDDMRSTMKVAGIDGVVLCVERFYDRERYEAVLAAQAGV